MSRTPGRPGFEVADIDTGLMADPKVNALARRLPTTVERFAAIGIYQATVLASWKEGRRLTAEDSLPGWAVDPVDELIDALAASGLLDGEHRPPESAWIKWFGTASDRRQEHRDRGARGGRAAAARREADGTADGTPSGTADGTADGTAGPSYGPTDRPTGPSGPSDRESARGANGSEAAPRDDDDRTFIERVHESHPLFVPPGPEVIPRRPRGKPEAISRPSFIDEPINDDDDQDEETT